jgi:hypothetical protein
MIQRVQTIFLLIATIAAVFMITIPFSRMVSPENITHEMHFYGLENTSEGVLIAKTLPLAVITVITGLLSFLTIIIYRRRVLQMRICVYNILITIAQFGLILYYYFSFKSDLGAGVTSFSFTIILPLINIILIFQAFRAIRRDDLLIKSYDRLR